MRLENETSESELIAKAFHAILKEVSYERLAKARLNAELGYSEAIRGAALPSHGGASWSEASPAAARQLVSLENVHGWKNARRSARRSLLLSRFASRPQFRGATHSVIVSLRSYRR
jgi:hypothetical protein